MRIGIAGTGKMGSAIARRLATFGHEIGVWNRTRARAEPLLQEAQARGLVERDFARVKPTERGFDFLSDLQGLFL